MQVKRLIYLTFVVYWLKVVKMEGFGEAIPTTNLSTHLLTLKRVHVDMWTT